MKIPDKNNNTDNNTYIWMGNFDFCKIIYTYTYRDLVNKIKTKDLLLWEQEVGSSNLSTPTDEKPMFSIKSPREIGGFVIYQIYSL